MGGGGRLGALSQIGGSHLQPASVRQAASGLGAASVHATHQSHPGRPPTASKSLPEHTNGTRSVFPSRPARPPASQEIIYGSRISSHPSPAKLPMLARPHSDHAVNWVGPHQAGAYLSNGLNRLSLGKTASHPQWKTNHRGSSLEIPNKLLSQDRGVAQENLTFLLDREAEGNEQRQFTWIGGRRID